MKENFQLINGPEFGGAYTPLYKLKVRGEENELRFRTQLILFNYFEFSGDDSEAGRIIQKMKRELEI